MSLDLLFPNFAELIRTPADVQRLNETILQLAVQGKLVPQDPNDEPAKELFARIQAGKQALIAQGTLREAPHREKIRILKNEYQLPPLWKWVRLSEIGIWANGTGFPKRFQGEKDLSILFCKVSDMNLPGNEVYIRNTKNTIDHMTAIAIRANPHPEGTVVFPKIGGAIATNKRRILVRPTAIDNNCLGINPLGICDSRWLHCLMSSIDLAEYQSGTSVPAVNQNSLSRIIIGLPPLAEQQRIVAKVDELFAQTRALEAKLRQAQEDVVTVNRAALHRLHTAQDDDQFQTAWRTVRDHFDVLYDDPRNVAELRQTILDLAVRGKLAPQDPNDEPARVLVRRIEAEKRRLIEAGEVKMASGLPPIAQGATEFELPQQWTWCRLGEIGQLINGDRGKNYPSSSELVSKGIPFINAGHLTNGVVDFTEMNYITEERFDALRSGKVMQDDLIYCLRGSLGKTAIVHGIDQGAIASSLVLIRLIDRASARFMFLVLVSPYGKLLIAQYDNGSAQPNLAAASVAKYIVPLPPLAEQQRIVAKVDQLVRLCDTLEAGLAQAEASRSTLTQAVLHQITN